MRVRLQRPGAGPDGDVVVSLTRADDFNDFGVDVGPGVDLDDVDFTLRAAGVGSLTDDRAHACIFLTWLAPRCVGTQSSRQPHFDAMVAFARQHGWMSEDGLSIRGHLKQRAATHSSPKEAPTG